MERLAADFDAARGGVDLKKFDFEFLVDFEQGGGRDAAVPGKFLARQVSVDAVELEKRAKAENRADASFVHGAYLEFGER